MTIHKALRFLHGRRAVVSLLLYACVVVVAFTGAYLLRFEFTVERPHLMTWARTLPILVAIRLVCNRMFNLSTSRWRFISTPDAVRLGGATTVGSLLFYGLTRTLPLDPVVPASVLLGEWVLTANLTAGLWIGYRTVFEQLRHYRSGFNGSAARVLIVGAGEAGSMLARELRRFPTGYRPIGFVDDDPAKKGTHLHGLEVLGSTRELRGIARQTRAREIIIAVPSASPRELRRIVQCCEVADLSFKVLPGIAEVLAGEIGVNQIREVRIEDLLGREPVQLELPELIEDLCDRSVLITGAAGSIGSELARQVALHRPRELVLLDQAETDLYYLDLELRDKHPDLEIVPVVADIVDRMRVEGVFARHRPDRVLHAAAYKHVPIMESNPGEAIRNNVIGTWRVADAAGRHGADRFVLVSTDKAVRPVSMMGATKRLAEDVVLRLQDEYDGTSYAAVRFGNVLGSNGSVIPVFKRQIERGEPLTVTHPEATRYFMTIAEAVQLILQASVLPDLRGQIAMLEMGEPVKILELARNLLRLSGSSTNGKNIRFTGLRPGERLHEQLVAPDERAVPTSIPKVRIVTCRNELRADVRHLVDEWERAFDAGADSYVVATVAEMFPGMHATEETQDQVPVRLAAR